MRKLNQHNQAIPKYEMNNFLFNLKMKGIKIPDQQ